VTGLAYVEGKFKIKVKVAGPVDYERFLDEAEITLDEQSSPGESYHEKKQSGLTSEDESTSGTEVDHTPISRTLTTIGPGIYRRRTFITYPLAAIFSAVQEVAHHMGCICRPGSFSATAARSESLTSMIYRMTPSVVQSQQPAVRSLLLKGSVAIWSFKPCRASRNTSTSSSLLRSPLR